MNKIILTDSQLKMKLINYNFVFNTEEFLDLKKHGFYHVFNSFVPSSDRTNGQTKNLKDYLKLYHLDFELRSLIFPMILALESLFKQRLNDTYIEDILSNHCNSPHYNEVVKYCIKTSKNVAVKKILFQSSSHRSQIVSHFFDNHNDIPIWAYFELLDLGSFLALIENSTDKDDSPNGINKIKEKFSDNCRFLQKNGSQFSANQKADYIFQSLRLIHSVRNHVAHNQPIIDGRYLKSCAYDIKKGKIQSMIHDVALTINPNLTIPDTNIYDCSSVLDVITVTYLLYIFMIGKDDISSRLNIFVKTHILDNILNIDSRVHSKIFKSNNRTKASFILSF